MRRIRKEKENKKGMIGRKMSCMIKRYKSLNVIKKKENVAKKEFTTSDLFINKKKREKGKLIKTRIFRMERRK